MRTIAIALPLAMLGCSMGGGTAEPMPDLTMLPDLTPADLKAVGYPEGPYGPAIGDTVPNFALQGYFAPAQTTGLVKDAPNMFGEVNLDMVRTAPGAKYAMLFLAGYT